MRIITFSYQENFSNTVIIYTQIFTNWKELPIFGLSVLLLPNLNMLNASMSEECTEKC